MISDEKPLLCEKLFLVGHGFALISRVEPSVWASRLSALHFALAYGKSGVAQVFLYHVCDATTYSPFFYGEISQIIRFFLTQNQSTLNQKSLVPIASSCCGVYAKGYYALFGAIAIAFDKDTNLVIFTPE
ncbi:MAG: hypothetical protein V7K24_21740 [Nostoc sp.]